jgi:hypothetical protein
MHVIKASGKRERFNPAKIRRSLLRTGVSRDTADEIIREVERRAHDGMSTRQVFRIVVKVLNEKQADIASRYDLKGAIMRLGPAGFHFETFVGEILEEYGFNTQLRTRVKGSCAIHEIDIIAEERDGGRRHLVECKYHNSLGNYIDLKEVLYTHARFLDLNNGGEDFDSVWISCNTRASTQAIKYAKCVGMKLLCWRYPKNEGLETLIEKKNLYPITVLRSLDEHSLDRLSRAGYMLVKDLTKNDFSRIKERTRLKTKKLQRIVEEAGGLY